MFALVSYGTPKIWEPKARIALKQFDLGAEDQLARDNVHEIIQCTTFSGCCTFS